MGDVLNVWGCSFYVVSLLVVIEQMRIKLIITTSLNVSLIYRFFRLLEERLKSIVILNE